MNVNIFDALVSVVAVALLVPRMGIYGYLVTIYITEILNAALSITRLLKITGYRPGIFSLIVRPLASVVGAACLARLLFAFTLTALTDTAAGLAVHVSVTVLFYLLLLFATGTLGREEQKWFFALFHPSKKDPSTRPRDVSHVLN